MVSPLLKSIFLFLTWPLRRIIRYELDRQARDIRVKLQQMATAETAVYVAKHMADVDSVGSEFELLTVAFKEAQLDKERLILEFGVFSGGTINHIAAMTPLPVYGFDSFEGLPERWRDGFGKGMFKRPSLPKVRSNVTLIKGWFDDVLPDFIQKHPQPISFLHIDCDLYSSTKTVFDLLDAQIQPGCIIVFDEYFNYSGWQEGEFKAFQEFVKRRGLAYKYLGYNRQHEQVAVKLVG